MKLVKIFEKMLLVLFIVISVAYATNTTDSVGRRKYERFIEVPIDGNMTTIVDLEAKPNTDLLNYVRDRSVDTNKYILYTSNNPSSAQEVSLYESSTLNAANFDPNLPTFVLIHGWHSHPNQPFDIKIKNALLAKLKANVFVVNWRLVAALDYATAVIAVPIVGRSVGRFMSFLNTSTGAPLTSMHIIGHSLGAHVAGNAGRELNGKVARITGLDPAGPLWYENPKRLNFQDALYVEAIHTNGLGFGIEKEVGDADFFPNGGTLQPGCLTITCNHSRSYELFAASIKFNNFAAKKCHNYLEMIADLCMGENFLMGNENLNKQGKGIFRLKTGDIYPYI